VVLELGRAALGQDLLEQALGPRGLQSRRVLVEPAQRPVDADERTVADLQVQVRSAELRQAPQRGAEVERCLLRR